ncbi:hypothetical protein Pmani_007225 [Petrolisthes manimaculis]|uniref:Upstream activation factor subunit spp27 n=1 Tax=Petrolisthes manimaculis TaxID=1843537 RepID=A0AAE1Q9C6_9EUCA|nr:hypothetical protein Pmani_007225 [Petrolisthes manimaculis]
MSDVDEGSGRYCSGAGAAGGEVGSGGSGLRCCQVERGGGGGGWLAGVLLRQGNPSGVTHFSCSHSYALVTSRSALAILKGADLQQITGKKVRQQVEQRLGVDLSDRRKEVDALIMADVEDQVNSHSDEEQSEEEVPKGKDESESEPESEEKGGDDDDYEPGAKKAARKPKASPKKRKASDDDDSDEDWGKRKKPTKDPENAKKGGGRGKKSAFTKSFKLSPELADVVGSDVMPRHEVVKKLWAVIKERELQDPKNKQYAICDDQLFKVIGVKRFRTFGMMKHLKDHFLEAA